MFMKKLFAGMAAAMLAAFLVFPCYGLSAEKAALLDGNTGRMIYEKNADQPGLIASTTKIMTALIICEQCNVLDRVRIPKEAVGIEGSSMYLAEGEILTVQELLYGLMLHSGNDAAVALAIYCGGTVEGFSELMNDKAHRLGLVNTHFENPNGLDSPGHYSSAEDLAALSAYAMKNPIFAKTVSTKNVKIGKRYLKNHNKLLWNYPDADGVKTGYTKAAGRILVSSATRSGRRLIAVTMRAPDDWLDHRNLLDMGFSDFKVEQIVKKGQCIGQIEIAGGVSGNVHLIADADFDYPVTEKESVEIVLQEPGFVYAPVAKGQKAADAYVCVDGSVVGKIPLIYGDTVEQEEARKEPYWKRLFGGR